MLRGALIRRALVHTPRGLLARSSPARLLVCLPMRTRSMSTLASALASLERRLDAHPHTTVDVVEVRGWLTTVRAEVAAGPMPLQDRPNDPLLRSELAVGRELDTGRELATDIVSAGVLAWELGRLSEQVAAMRAKGLLVPSLYGFRQDALTLRSDLMHLYIRTGQLSREAYLQRLRVAIPAEMARAKAFESQPGGERKALEALKRAEIMEEEIVALKPRSASGNDPPFFACAGLCFLSCVWMSYM